MTSLIESTHPIGEEAINDDSVFPVLSTGAAMYNIPVCSSNFSIPSSSDDIGKEISDSSVVEDSISSTISKKFGQRI